MSPKKPPHPTFRFPFLFQAVFLSVSSQIIHLRSYWSVRHLDLPWTRQSFVEKPMSSWKGAGPQSALFETFWPGTFPNKSTVETEVLSFVRNSVGFALNATKCPAGFAHVCTIFMVSPNPLWSEWSFSVVPTAYLGPWESDGWLLCVTLKPAEHSSQTLLFVWLTTQHSNKPPKHFCCPRHFCLNPCNNNSMLSTCDHPWIPFSSTICICSTHFLLNYNHLTENPSYLSSYPL